MNKVRLMSGTQWGRVCGVRVNGMETIRVLFIYPERGITHKEMKGMDLSLSSPFSPHRFEKNPQNMRRYEKGGYSLYTGEGKKWCN